MCGITGSFPVGDRHRVRTMSRMLQHRGPDDSGLFTGAKACLGHRRLAIVDVRGGHQPLGNETGRLQIVFNGEIYNHNQLRSALPGHRFKTRTDTEVIVHLFEQLQANCVRLLDGMFAFAIHDGEALFLARDPLGIKPLYYSNVEGTTYFASEIKALLPLTHQIHEFPPGTRYHSARGFERYFELRPGPPRRTTISESTQQVRRTLAECVRKRIPSEVPFGVCLSGGLDSTLIALLASEERRDLKTFSVGAAGSEDLQYARLAASFLGTQHYEYVYTAAEMHEVLPRVIYHLESFDPALVRSAVANYFLARLASQHVKVVLCGEGADELFGGYEYLKPFANSERFDRELVEITAALHHTNLQRVDRMTMAFGLEARVPFLDLSMVRLAFRIPSNLKLLQGTEKWILRHAFERDLPEALVWRRKEKFARGCNSAETFQQWAESAISEPEYERERRVAATYTCGSREELHYYRLFQQRFPAEALLPLVGRSRSL